MRNIRSLIHLSKIRRSMIGTWLSALTAASLVLVVMAPAVAHGQARPAQLAFALTTGNVLVRMDTTSPSIVAGRVAVTGLQAGESLVGIDFRPANNALYAVGSTGRLYSVDPNRGVAQAIGAGPVATALRGTAFGVDFNPSVDRLRVVSTDAQNLRINVDTLEVLNDGALAYAAGDRNAGAPPSVVAAGYTNNAAGATPTMLFVVDASRDVLALQNPPNDGVLNTVGPLGVNTSEVTAFDVASGTGMAYAVLTPAGATASTLYMVNLTTGAATRVGVIGGGQPVRGLALVLDGTSSFAPVTPGRLPQTGASTDWLMATLAGAGVLLLGAGLARRRRPLTA